MKDIEDEIPFEVPEGWELCRLGQIYYHTTGKALKKSNEKGSLKKYITTSNLYWDTFDFTEVRSMYFTDEELEKCTIKKGDLVLCNGGDVGRAAIWNYDEEICYQNHVSRMRPKTTGINNRFYLYILMLYKEQDMLNGKGVGISSLSASDLLSAIVPLPPEKQQTQIVAKIEEIFAQIDSLEKDKSDLQSTIKQAKSKILDLAIHGKLVPQDSSDEPAYVLLEKLRAEKEAKIKAGDLKRDKNDSYIYKNTTDNCYYEKFNGKEAVCIDDEIPFEIPNSWQWCKLNELGETNIGLTYHPTDLVNTGIPVLRSNNIQNDSLCLDDLARVQTKILENQFVSDGDILICARNGSQALVGKCTIIDKLPEKMAFGAFMAIFRSKYNKYIIRYLQSFYFKDYLRESNSTQIYQLTQSMLKNALIPLPPISEQKRIATKIEEMFNLLDQIQSNLV